MFITIYHIEYGLFIRYILDIYYTVESLKKMVKT